MLEKVMKVVILQLQEHVLKNTVQGTEYDLVELAELPAVILFAPIIEKVRYDDSNETRSDKNFVEGTYKETPAPFYYNLVFKFEIITEKTLDLLAIQQKMLIWLEENPYLDVEELGFPLQYSDIHNQTTQSDTKEGLRRSAGSFTIEGVEIMSNKTTEGKLATSMRIGYKNLNNGAWDFVEFKVGKEQE